MHLSVVSPVYQGEKTVTELMRRLVSAISPLTQDFEIILVDDGSKDHSWKIIQDLAQQESRIKALQFSRNFGQHHALTAGLDICQGDWVVMMDCDLQDRPEEVPRLYAKAKEGFDVVVARRGKRKDGLLKKFCNWAFYKIFNFLTGMQYDPQVGGFRIMSKKVVIALRTMREQHRFINGLIHWMGFRTASVDTEHAARLDGKSTYTFIKLLKFSLEIITSYSEKPLKISALIGFIIALLAFAFGVAIFIKAFFYGTPVSGWSSLIISLYFLSGVMMMVLGVLGIYLGKVLSEVKNRPLYVISHAIGVDTSK
ncbi:MAG: glycosyltransferase [Patescibacteria group bacterium]